MPTNYLDIDPLGNEFLETVHESITQSVIKDLEENNIRLTRLSKPERKPRINQVPFHISKDLKKRLNILLASTEDNSPAKKIATHLLSLKRVPEDCINYLDLSKDDFTKISYITPERIERVKGKVFEVKSIVPGTLLIYKTKSNNYGVYEEDGDLKYGSFEKEMYNSYKFFKSKLVEPVTLDRIKVPIELITHEDGTKEMKYEYKYVVPVNFSHRFYDYKLRISVFIQDGEVSTHDPSKEFSYKFENLKTKVVSSIWDPDQRFHSTVHKVLNKIFGETYTEREKNIFAELYYKQIVFKDPSYMFSVKDGEDIRRAYLEFNYPTQNDSPLWRSCMRYECCQQYLDFYCNHPDKIKIAVLSKNNKVVARALVWIVDNGETYYDRIYFYNNQAEAMLENSLKAVGYRPLRQPNGCQIEDLSISFSRSDIYNTRYFPYMDSFQYYSFNEDALLNYEPNDSNYWKFCETDGSYEDFNSQHCLSCDCTRSLDDYEFHYIGAGRRQGETYCSDCTVYSDGLGTHIERDSAQWCEHENSYYPSEDCVELTCGEFAYKNHEDLCTYENNYGYFLMGIHDYVEIDGDYYDREDPILLELLNENIEENENNNETIEETNENQTII